MADKFTPRELQSIAPGQMSLESGTAQFEVTLEHGTSTKITGAADQQLDYQGTITRFKSIDGKSSVSTTKFTVLKTAQESFRSTCLMAVYEFSRT